MSTRGNVKQDRHGWFYVVVNVPSTNGKRRQLRKRGFVTKKAAQEALTEVLGQVAHGTFVRPARTTIGAYLDEWLTSLRRAGPAPRRSTSTPDG